LSCTRLYVEVNKYVRLKTGEGGFWTRWRDPTRYSN
jgi:hypothetical protein